METKFIYAVSIKSKYKYYSIFVILVIEEALRSLNIFWKKTAPSGLVQSCKSMPVAEVEACVHVRTQLKLNGNLII